MEIKNLTITLTHHRKEIEELYFPGNSGSFWKGEDRRQYIYWFIAMIIAAPCFMTIAKFHYSVSWIVFGTLSALAALFLFIVLLVKGIFFYRRKKLIVRFINQIQGTTETVICTDESITFIMPDATLISRWEAVQKVVIRKNQLFVFSGQDEHLLPLSSMGEEAFTNLTAFIKSKLIPEKIVSKD